MKKILSINLLLITVSFSYSQVTESFDGVTISGSSFTTTTGLSFTTSDTFESYGTDLQNEGVTLTAPIPHVYLDQSDSFFEFTPTSTDKLLSSLSFDLWYSNSNTGTTLACECKSYDSSGNLLETISKDVIVKVYNFSGTPKKVRCNITEINSGNAVFFDDITFTLVDPNDVFTLNSTSGSGIESSYSNSSTGVYSFSVGLSNTASGEHSIAIGQQANASGLSSLASGYDTTASGAYSSAFGQSTTASGSHSSAFGNLSTATAFTSFSAGSDSHANGAASIALGSGANAQNDYAVAIGHGATTTAESSVALGYNVTASGLAATAMGGGTIASGNYSTSMGLDNTASGELSTAMGGGTTASGFNSASFGAVTTASGGNSVAMGYLTKASDYASLAIGYYNYSGSTISASADQPNETNTAFVIGNGVDNINRSDALVVKFNGDTTLAGSVTAASFIGDGSGLTGLPNQDYDLLNNIPIELYDYNNLAESGIQSRTSTASGIYSFAVGDNSVSSGTHSFSYGNANQATGNGSFAGGSYNVTSGLLSTAFGTSNEAQTNYSIAAGYDNTSSGFAAVTFGFMNTTSGSQAFSVGTANTASGAQSLAIGSGNTSSGVVSTALGSMTTSSGRYATTTGKGTISSGFGSMAIGVYNIENTSDSVDLFDASNTAFVIGNGTETNPDQNGNTTITRSDAFKVLFDGTTTIAGDLNINSDAKLKANIISLGSTLAKLLQIDGKTYTLKKDANNKQKIGLLAQDIEKVFPELVSENNGVKSVNYQGLVPVLINALKDQQSEIDELKSMVHELINKN